jgi:hypothetical protein
MHARLFFSFTPFRHSLGHLFESLSGQPKHRVGRIGPIKTPFTGCNTREQFQGHILVIQSSPSTEIANDMPTQ